MKALLLAVLSLCFTVGAIAVAQAPPSQTPQKHPGARIRITSMMGTVRAGGEQLTFVTDQRVWNVDNPGSLESHQGHYVRVEARVDADIGSIYITEVKQPTAAESRKNDIR
jgi:hypothetical protein